MVDVLVLNYNDSETTGEFIERVRNYQNVRKILVVDNCSTDDSYDVLLNFESPKIEVVKTQSNGGYGAGNNFGIKYLVEKYHSEHILLSNPDVIVDEATINKLENFLAEHDDYVIVAPVMCDRDGVPEKGTAWPVPTKWQYILGLELFYNKYGSCCRYDGLLEKNGLYQDVGVVAGSMFLMDAQRMLEFGMYDENIFLYCEETVLGLKLQQAQQKTALLLQENFIHNHSVSISKTFKSTYAKKVLHIRSRLYVIKHYYKANCFEYSLAWILGKVSILEVCLWENIKGVMRK